MLNVPKIVHERLRIARPAATHPDPDVLTAFAEQSLLERERATVLEHLSRCGDCRDIVALALPASETLEPVVRKSHGFRVAWPAFRWAFASAGLVAIAFFGVLQFQRHAKTPMMAYQAQTPSDSEARRETPAVPAPQSQPEESNKFQDRLSASASAGKPESLNTRASGAVIARDKVPVAAMTPGVVGGRLKPLPHGPLQSSPLQSNQWQQQQGANNVAQVPAPVLTANATAKAQPAPAAPSSPADVRVAVSSEAAQVQSPPAPTPAQSDFALIVKNEPPQPPPGGQAETKVDRAKPALTVTPEKTIADSDQVATQGRSMKALIARAGPRWSISSQGSLQRSFDQGVTWQKVNPDGASTRYDAAGATSLEVAAPSRAKDAKEKDSTKALKKGQPGAQLFRTVVANGSEVWAGGGSGLLYHSSDSGAHWTRIVPSSAGTFLTGDILSMDFPDPQHGRISTSTGETWSTTDSGQTWQKQ